jgi:hypothetical protein
MDTKLKEHVETLIAQAALAKASHDALHFSQAACNAANAVRQLEEVKRLT